MLKDTETRLALQAARGIQALQTLENIRELSLNAQSSRDEAKLRYDTQLERINDEFTLEVMRQVNDYASKVKHLDVDSDYYQDDDDD